jgi:hypothetical protein
MNNQNTAMKLELMLTAFEDDVLGIADRDILADGDSEVETTASFIANRLATRRATALPPLAQRRSSPKSNVRRVVPRDAAGRRRLLGRLIATRSALPAHISMAFTSREPDDSEVAQMLDELLRDGDGSVTE